MNTVPRCFGVEATRQCPSLRRNRLSVRPGGSHSTPCTFASVVEFMATPSSCSCFGSSARCVTISVGTLCGLPLRRPDVHATSDGVRRDVPEHVKPQLLSTPKCCCPSPAHSEPVFGCVRGDSVASFRWLRDRFLLCLACCSLHRLVRFLSWSTGTTLQCLCACRYSQRVAILPASLFEHIWMDQVCHPPIQWTTLCV